jgi:hypothetical protein
MAEYFSPGVYVEEYDNSPRAIEGVGTSTAGFVGLAEKGAAKGAPVLVTDMKSFNRNFGSALSEFTHGEYRFLAPAVEQFFTNGGTRCFVARVIPDDAKKASVKKGILTITAKNEGKWGNRIQVTVESVAKRKLQLMEEKGGVYTAKNLEGFKEGDLVVVGGKEYNRIATIFENTVTFEKPFETKVVDSAVIPKTVLYLVTVNMSIRSGDEVENYAELSFNPTSANYIDARLAKSEIVDIVVEQMKAPADPVAAILGDGSSAGIFSLEGGSDGTIGKVNAGTFIGVDKGPGERTGIQAFLENDLVSMMAVPGVTAPEVSAALIGHCEKLKSRFAVLDMPKDLSKPDELIEYRNIFDSTYAAMYHPWIQVFDRSANKPDFVPPSGAVLGVYSRTDMNRGVHKAPANEAVFCSGLSVNYTKAEQDILNPEGVNLIRQLPGQGIRIWGARTASSNGTFKYVNVRRLFIYVEESIKASTNWVVFEPNDVTLWQRVNMTVSGFLDTMWRTGMLAGGSSSEAYFVEIGPSTMTQDDILSGRLICNIGIAPSRPAEFVIFRVTQNTSESGGGGGE